MTPASWGYAAVVAACFVILAAASLTAGYNWITNRYLGPLLIFAGYAFVLMAVVSFFVLGFWGTA